jgi:uncharacterized protein involved in exopolysaccharide biosynthesis
VNDPAKLSAPKSASWAAQREGVRDAHVRPARRARIIRFMAGFGAVLASALIIWPVLPRRFEASASVILHASEQDDAQSGIKQGILDDGAIQSEMDRMSSPLIVDQAIARTNLLRDPAFTGPGVLTRMRASLTGSRPEEPIVAGIRATLRERISVVRERRAYTLKVSIWDRDAHRAAAIANALIDAYIDDQISRKQQALDAHRLRLEQRAELLRASHQNALEAVRAFMAQTGISDKGDGSELLNQLTTLSAELAQSRARAIEAKARFEGLARMQKLGVLLNAPEVLSAPSVQKARELYAAARAKPANLAAETMNLQSQLDEEAQRIVHAADQEAATWRAREDMLRDEVSSTRSELVRRRLDELRLDELRREALSDETALTDALAKLKAQLGRTRAIQPDADIVGRAEAPRIAAFPNLTLASLGTLLLAALVGVFAAARPGLLRRSFIATRRLWAEICRSLTPGKQP